MKEFFSGFFAVLFGVGIGLLITPPLLVLSFVFVKFMIWWFETIFNFVGV